VNCPLLAEEGLNLCVVPPRALEPALDNVVQVLQLDWTTGTCPKGYHVVHLSQAALASEVQEDDPGLFGDLERAFLALLSHSGGQAHCLFRCTYLQRPRRPRRWDSATPDGRTLESCASGRSLLVCADPVAVPQLLAGAEVGEARSIFLRAPLHSGEAPREDDFLRKPTHVAQEERGSATEELAHFNEQMLSTERESAGAPRLAHASADEGGADAADPASARDAAGVGAPPEAATNSASEPTPVSPPAAEGPPAQGEPSAGPAAGAVPAAGGAEAGAGGAVEPPPGGPDAAGGGRA